MARNRSLDIAVTGVSGRFPGSSDLAEWWEALKAGRVLTTRYDRRRLVAAGMPEDLVDEPDFVPVHGHLADFDRFENALFRVSPREAEMMDPQLRLMLECAWTALEDAAVDPLNTRATTGVYASASASGYLHRMIAGGMLDPLTAEDALHGAAPDFLASLISYKLNLTGPALAVQTACSSSLVALHMAVQGLLSGECDQALVVAAGLAYPQAGHLRVPGGIHSASGHCRPFDENADGVVAGSGVACVVLRRFDDALTEGPEPYGVVLGTAVNNDGAAKAGYYAPSVGGQQAAIRAALDAADVDGASIGYLETHGTGTRIGDPIEWSAASSALREAGARPGQIAVGALKANTGHLDNAAGLAGLTKALLVVRDGVVPPLAGFTRLNPLLETEDSPLYVPTQVAPWTGPEPRRAGVSSFGVGGTNVHVVVERAPVRAARREEAGAPPAAHLVVLSAADGAALDRSAERLSRHLAADAPRTADVAHTLATGRAALGERLAVTGHTPAEVAERLSTGAGVVRGSRPVDGPTPLVLAFPGQGSQRPGMALPFAEALPGFSAALTQCLDAFEPALARVLEVALSDPGFPEGELAQTRLAQPALFAVEYAVAAALRGLGLVPAAVVGHSLGEITAACVAGVFELPDAARLVALRGRVMQDCAPGAMLALGCGESETRALIAASGQAVEPAAFNSPEASVVAGAEEAVAAFEAWLAGRVHARRLRTSHAFHSALIEPAVAPLADELSRIAVRPPAVPWATTSGRMVLPGEAVAPQGFAERARTTVRFAEALDALATRQPGAVVVEAGPGRALSAIAAAADLTALPLAAGHGAPAGRDVLTALGTLWTMGQPLVLETLCAAGEPIRLPSYPCAGPCRIAPEAAARPVAPRPATEACVPADADGGTTASTAPGPDPAEGPDVPALLTRLWRELLGHEDLTVEADFFLLGGDSLLVTHLARKLRTELGIRVPMRDLLLGRTLGRQIELVHGLVEPVPVPVAAGG
ncbi:acyltransferase domain-containing protein [Streptomyces inhibens]|uniref:Acyltransferase domain-containing protein n=1 Tax=Streptomyces inhibens TaxID=2293571 RepID=A0A371PPT1_STRIH|nr:type I polyketide synthase [Streptomyces inhibens]REK84534.1 acyltransferase domain-containing protein [Streptomyces inhibens]